MLSLDKLVVEDYACQCKQARLGGKILSATALQGQMKLEILSLPLISLSAKPSLSAETNGRFIAYLEGFIDPERLKEQFITVKGTLKNQKLAKLIRSIIIIPLFRSHIINYGNSCQTIIMSQRILPIGAKVAVWGGDHFGVLNHAYAMCCNKS